MIVALALLALWYWRLPAQGPIPPADSERQPAVAILEPPTAQSFQVAALDPAPTTVTGHVAIISGQVVWEDSSEPIADIVVHLRPWRLGPGPFFDLIAPPTWLTKTDAAGQFHFDEVAAGDYVLSREEWPGGEALRKVDHLHLQLSQGELAEGIVLRVKRGLTASGRVLDFAARPVSRAIVEIERSSNLPRHTDGLGRFTVEGLSRGESRLVRASAPGYAARSDLLRTREVESPGIELQLTEPGYAMSGRVVNDCGTPLHDVTVAIESGKVSARTDFNGAFELRGIPTQEEPVFLKLFADRSRIDLVSGGGPYIIGPSAQRSGLLLVAPIRAGFADLLAMEAGTCHGNIIKGHVLCSEGRPIAGAEVTAMSGDGVFGLSLTSENGTYILPIGSDPAFQILAVASRFERSGILDRTINQPDTDLHLLPAKELHVRVIDASTGQPVRRFRVFDFSEKGFWEMNLTRGIGEHSTSIFDVEGRFSWTLPSENAEMLRIMADGYAPEMLEAAPGDTLLTVAMRPDRRIAGIVVDETGSPVRDVIVAVTCEISDATHDLVFDMDGHGIFHIAEVLTDNAGRFTIEGLDGLDYDVEAGGGRYGYETEEADLTATVSLQMRIALTTTGEIAGIAISEGQPVEGVLVVAHMLEESSHVGNNEGMSTTDVDGQFLMRALLPGIYQVSCMMENVDDLQRVNFDSTVVELEPGYECFVEFEGARVEH